MKNRWQKKDRARRQIVDRDAITRLELKAKIRDASTPKDEAAQRALQLSNMTRDGSSTRICNRCVEDGSARSVLRQFRRSRFTVRKRALNGDLPGYGRCSW